MNNEVNYVDVRFNGNFRFDKLKYTTQINIV